MNRSNLLCLLVLLPVAPAAASAPVAAGPAPLEAYAAVGASFTRDNRLHQLGWTEAQVEAFLRGVREGLKAAPPALDADAQALLGTISLRLQELDREEQRRQFGAEAFARPGYLAQYLKDIRKRFNLEASDTGLSYAIKSNGAGARPEPEDSVIISYKVNAADLQGEVPGLGGQRIKVRIADLVPGLAEALQMMSAGNTAMLVVPPDLSYGEGEWPAGAERGTPLIFAVALHEIVPAL